MRWVDRGAREKLRISAGSRYSPARGINDNTFYDPRLDIILFHATKQIWIMLLCLSDKSDPISLNNILL